MLAANCRRSRFALHAGVVLPLVILGVFKYFNFFVGSFCELFGLAEPGALKLLPVGISFYTFQTMSYTIDVYRKVVPAQHNIVAFATYVTLFPQLIAGPIVQYKTVASELSDRKVTLTDFSEGAFRFTIGLAKKVLLANQIGSLWDSISQLNHMSVATAWLGAIAYSFQIYFDFSGYSDMAIGLGRMFGFYFLENFNFPYMSKTITEFWRRWHISLSSWFREYVYIPLGGNRKGLVRQLFNIMVVWMLTGLWHGASWNFVLWGVYFGIIIIIEKLFLGKYLEKAPAFLSHLYAIFLFTFGWVLFDFTDMGQMRDFIVSLFNGGSVGLISHDALVYVLAYLPVLIVSIIASTPLVSNLHKKIENRAWCGYADAALVLIALVICTASLVSSGYNPFIYFRF